MRKLNVENYINEIKVNENGATATKEIEYEFKDSLIFIMFNRELQLAGKSLLEQNKLAEKILEADKEIILEEAEYNKIKQAVETFKGCTRNEVQLVDRVLNCPQINVEEKKTDFNKN